MPSAADDLVFQNDLYKTLKNIETILMRIDERFGEYYPIYAESQDAAKRFADALERKRAESMKSCNCDPCE